MILSCLRFPFPLWGWSVWALAQTCAAHPSPSRPTEGNFLLDSIEQRYALAERGRWHVTTAPCLHLNRGRDNYMVHFFPLLEQFGF